MLAYDVIYRTRKGNAWHYLGLPTDEFNASTVADIMRRRNPKWTVLHIPTGASFPAAA